MNLLQRQRSAPQLIRTRTDDAAPTQRRGAPSRGAASFSGNNSGVSPLFELQPGVAIKPAYFTVIPIPATLPTIAAGQSYWYLLRRIKPAQSTELTLQLVRAYLKAPNWNNGSGYGIAAGSCAAWGDASEPAAQVVVGNNLPGNIAADGTSLWTPAPADLPGIEQNITASNASSLSPAEYAARIPFPSGKWNDTNGAPMLPLAIPFGFGQWSVTQGNTLDVALVVRSSQVTAGTSKYIVGMALIELVCNIVQGSGNVVTGNRGE